jgi:hypothetical protein
MKILIIFNEAWRYHTSRHFASLTLFHAHVGRQIAQMNFLSDTLRKRIREALGRRTAKDLLDDYKLFNITDMTPASISNSLWAVFH